MLAIKTVNFFARTNIAVVDGGSIKRMRNIFIEQHKPFFLYLPQHRRSHTEYNLIDVAHTFFFHFLPSPLFPYVPHVFISVFIYLLIYFFHSICPMFLFQHKWYRSCGVFCCHRWAAVCISTPVRSRWKTHRQHRQMPIWRVTSITVHNSMVTITLSSAKNKIHCNWPHCRKMWKILMWRWRWLKRHAHSHGSGHRICCGNILLLRIRTEMCCSGVSGGHSRSVDHCR